MQWIKLDRSTITDELFSQLIQLEETCGLEPYTPEMLSQCVYELDTYAWINDGTIAGFITVLPSRKALGGGIYIVNLNVGSSRRRQGLGRTLMQNALAHYGHSHQGAIVTLDVAKTNIPALNLYQKLGFVLTDFPSRNGPDDYVMLTKLDLFLGTCVTERLHLRSMIPENAVTLASILKEYTVKATYMVPDLDDAAANRLALRIIALSHEPDRYVRGIYRKDQLIGFLNDVEIQEGSIELGWVISPAERNNGYATEAVEAAINDLFRKGYQRIVAGAFAENKASIRVMEKVGMQPVAKTEEIEYRGQTHKCVYFERCKS